MLTIENASEYPTARAYNIGYNEGDKHRAAGRPECMEGVDISSCLADARDESDREFVRSAAYDGYYAGFYGSEPLDAVQIAIHYD